MRAAANEAANKKGGSRSHRPQNFCTFLFRAISSQEQLPWFVIPEGNPRFARISKTTSGGEPL
jgi:hypothetical protein